MAASKHQPYAVLGMSTRAHTTCFAVRVMRSLTGIPLMPQPEARDA